MGGLIFQTRTKLSESVISCFSFRPSGLTPDAASYAGAIIACDLAGMWSEAVGLLDDMRERAGIE